MERSVILTHRHTLVEVMQCHVEASPHRSCGEVAKVSAKLRTPAEAAVLPENMDEQQPYTSRGVLHDAAQAWQIMAAYGSLYNCNFAASVGTPFQLQRQARHGLTHVHHL